MIRVPRKRDYLILTDDSTKIIVCHTSFMRDVAKHLGKELNQKLTLIHDFGEIENKYQLYTEIPEVLYQVLTSVFYIRNFVKTHSDYKWSIVNTDDAITYWVFPRYKSNYFDAWHYTIILNQPEHIFYKIHQITKYWDKLNKLISWRQFT